MEGIFRDGSWLGKPSHLGEQWVISEFDIPERLGWENGPKI